MVIENWEQLKRKIQMDEAEDNFSKAVEGLHEAQQELEESLKCLACWANWKN